MTKRAKKEAAIRALEKKGKVNPRDLIKAAKDPRHPCHDDFTWDDSAAAEKWRHHQAKELIRELRFNVVVDEVRFGVVAYVSSPDSDATFDSLPKMRGVVKVSALLGAEVDMLCGQASRVYGIAVAKQNIVGAKTVAKLRIVRDTLAALKEELQE